MPRQTSKNLKCKETIETQYEKFVGLLTRQGLDIDAFWGRE